MKDFLNNLITTKEARATELKEKIKAATTADEVRSLGDELQSVNDEIAAAKVELLKFDEKGAGEPEVPDTAQRMDPMASFNVRGKTSNENPLDSMEYRTAFMKYVQTGEWNYRSDNTLLTTDVGKIIPNTVMQEFIKDLKIYGTIFNRVRKLNVKGGVEFPIQDLVPTVTWITETTVSDTQKAPEIKTSISFGYHIVEARLSQSLLSQVVSLTYLEQEMARLLAEAFVKEFDNVIINGSGSGQPLGILKDTRVKAANKITFTDTELADWTSWRKKFVAKIPLAYRGQGMFIMTVHTWETYIMTLKDKNDRPLASETVNAVDGTTTCRFMGKEVQLVEPDIIKDYDAAGTGEAWAICFRPVDYAVNTNLQIGFKRWFDDDKNKWVNKGLCIMDGKLLDVNGTYIFTKTTAT